MKRTFLPIIALIFVVASSDAQQIAVLKYGGGGDWYSNPTALPNLIKFCNANLGTKIDPQPETVEAGSVTIFKYPFLHMTGHGNVFFTDDEVQNLKTYLMSGGFLHIDDNYGMEPYLRRELQKLFPDKQLEELGADHPIFDQKFKFPGGLPKIHEHDGKRPQAFGVFDNGRLILLYTFECDLGDGWEDPTVHNDPEEVRQRALQMGANIVAYAFKS
ncbi:protein of unknown function [Flagellimonas taeanensis]|jgi:hypothetical protein|uniref:DUF4159 domain-containing protein n=1 Tax=Flagellimonas taeanensis TaxID=1005926 RepID=A0A1M6UYH7_9FLAO|nr:DUF4159 domain-containing protein [Allomuricauda taeanensis]SFC22221.1 protein of unknown function [Allomuricauda taeanensis]SHK74268.1 protein of unknown function [Allomuricauda taeanensis]